MLAPYVIEPAGIDMASMLNSAHIRNTVGREAVSGPGLGLTPLTTRESGPTCCPLQLIVL